MKRTLLGALVALMAPFAFQPALAQSAGYRIQPGDELAITVLEDDTLNRTALVLPDGQISVPLAGSIRASGQSVDAVEKVIADHDKVVIATAGGIVSSPETYALLLRRTHTVWVKAQPQEHMNRVIAQGDLRPMSENREAMGDLLAILEARSQDYAQAETELDTSGRSVEQSVDDLVRQVSEWTK